MRNFSASICAVLTFDPQLQKILIFSVKDRYQLNYFICIKDFNAETNTSLKLNLFSVPHYLSDIRNIYIKADHFPLMMLTAANKERKQI
jgi:hypothetical protein